MPRGKLERYLVVFGWYVDATSTEDARLKAKKNLAYENERRPVDLCQIKKGDRESRDKDFVL